MITRIYDANLVHEASTHFLKSEHLCDAIDWIANSDNIILKNEKGDYALFEKGVKHIYTGHYYFKSRGKKALQVAKEFIDELFNMCYNINILMGLVPVKHLGARWITRQLGFTSYGNTQVDDKQYEMFILTKQEFNQ